VTGDTALRLGHFFGTSAEFWLNLQKLYELRRAEEKVGETIKDLPTLAKKAGGNSQPQPCKLMTAIRRIATVKEELASRRMKRSPRPVGMLGEPGKRIAILIVVLAAFLAIAETGAKSAQNAYTCSV
jgi:hypothetical protein